VATEGAEIIRFILDTPITYSGVCITSDLNRGPATEPPGHGAYSHCERSQHERYGAPTVRKMRAIRMHSPLCEFMLCLFIASAVDACHNRPNHETDINMTHPSDKNPSDNTKGGSVPDQQADSDPTTYQNSNFDNSNFDHSNFDIVLNRVHQRVTSVEPVARDLNRHLVDLLGPCPATTANGEETSWVTIVEDATGNHLLQLPLLSVTEALRVSTALATLARSVDFSDVRRTLSPSSQYRLPFIVSESVRRVSGHVSVVRP